jgi:hypothetical protein
MVTSGTILGGAGTAVAASPPPALPYQPAIGLALVTEAK